MRFLWRSGKIHLNIKRHLHHFLQSSDRSLAMTIESCKSHWMALRELHMPRPRYFTEFSSSYICTSHIWEMLHPHLLLRCARQWRCRATRAACTSSSALPARLPPPTRSRREHSGGQWTRWGGWELVVIVSLPMPISSACWRARPKKDRRHVPVLRGWQQDSLLPPLGIHKTMIIGRFCFVIMHFLNFTFRCLLSVSWIKKHFAELFYEQTNIISNARPV